MAERLKHSYGPEVALWVGRRLARVLPDLDLEAFAAECLPGHEDLELMDRARHIADVMARHLPPDPAVAVTTITPSLGPAGSVPSAQFGRWNWPNWSSIGR